MILPFLSLPLQLTLLWNVYYEQVCLAMRHISHKGEFATRQTKSCSPFPVKVLGLEVMTMQYCLRHFSIQLPSAFEFLDDARNASISDSVQPGKN